MIGPTTAASLCTTRPHRAIRCSYEIQASPVTAESMWQRQACIAIFRSGLPMTLLSISLVVFRPTTGTSGEFDRPARGLERITTQNARVTYPVMLDRRTLLYLATDADGSGPWMYSVDVEQRRPHRISSGLEGYSSLAASADGARLITTIANPRTSVWRTALNKDSAAAAPAQATRPSFSRMVSHPGLAKTSLLYVAWRGE